MAGNLIKGGLTAYKDNSKYVIKGNDAAAKILEELKAKMTPPEPEVEEENLEDGEFSEGLNPLVLEKLVSDTDEEGQNIIEESQEGFSSGLDSIATSVSPKGDSKIIGGVFEETNAEAEKIIQNALSEAEAIKADAQATGFDQGYNEGLAKGQADATAQFQAKAAKLEADYNAKVNQIKAEYEELKNKLEPMLVDKLTDIYQQVIEIDLYDDREFISKLINRVMSGEDGGRNYIIHVSGDDLDNVVSNKEDILKGTGISPELVEIIEDNSLNSGGCFIESELGIFDCGLDTQLTLLKKQLKLISIE